MISKEKLIELYVDKKLSQTEIGKMFGCDRKNVDYYLKKYGIKKRSLSENGKLKRKLPNLTIDDILKRIEEGMLIGDICKELNISRSTLGKLCNENGYNFRNHKIATKKQSDFMKNNNPIPKGTTRTHDDILKSVTVREYNYINYLNNIDISSIPYWKYAKLSRAYAYSHIFNKDIDGGYHIDHIFSIKHGYENKIPITLISHINNLRIIPKHDNYVKGCKSLISLQEFYELVGVQRLSKTQLNAES